MKKLAYTLAFLSLITISLPANSSEPKFVRSGGEVSRFKYEDWQTGIIGDAPTTSLKRINFEPDDWQKNLLERRKMLNDLTRTQRLVGLRKADVRKLLGDPKTFGTKYPFDDNSKKNTDWYPLPHLGCGSSPKDYFVLKYSRGRVIGYREVTEALVGPKYFKRLQAEDPHWHET